MYKYVDMKCVLTNGFMQSMSPDPVHRRFGLEGTTNYFGIRTIGLGDSIN